MAEGKPHQGVVATSGEFEYWAIEDILAQKPTLLLVLDGVQDPQNLGALVRSANVLGVDGVIVPKDRAAQVTATVVKASAGATEHTRIAQVTNISRALEQIREAEIWIVGTAVEGTSWPWQVDFKLPTAIVLGSEGKGMRPLVREHCDVLCKIPMHGQVESLNVSASGAILLYEVTRQRA
jgi:23S rRNA (guanosine2251-2'-O)-methyltransferase